MTTLQPSRSPQLRSPQPRALPPSPHPHRSALPLTAEAEVELGRRIEAGVLAAAVLDGHRRAPDGCTRDELARLVDEGRDAREELVLANQGLVAMAVGELARPGDSRDDLRQAGALGLLEAVDRYDHRRPNRFATYALLWVRNLVRATQASQAQGNLSSHRRRQLRQVRYEQMRLSQHEGREVSLRQAAEALGVDTLIVLDDALAGVPDELREWELPDLRQDARRPDIPVGDLLSELTEREREFCRRRFGFEGDPVTLSVIAEDWGWTVARVHRFERRVLNELRGIMPASWAA